MQFRSNSRLRRGTAALAAATASVGLASIAHAQIYTSTTSVQAQVEPGEVYNTANGASASFFDLEGAANTFKDWGVLQFSTPALAAGTTVTSVNSDLNLTLAFDSYSRNTIPPTTLSFYLTTDTATSVTAATGSGLNYETAFPGGFDPTPGDVGTFGYAGIGSPGTQIIPIGTANFSADMPSSTIAIADGTLLTYSLTLNTAAENFIKQQMNTSSPVKLIIVNPETDSKYAGWYGSGSGFLPSLAFDVNTSTTTNNTSLLYAGTSGTSKSVAGGVNVGKQLSINGTPTYCALLGATTTAPVTIYNGSSTAGDNLTYTVQVASGLGGGSSTSPGPEPIAPGASAQATVGFNGADTTGLAGVPISGTVNITNASNTNDAAPVTVALNPTLILQERFVNSAVGTQANPSITPNVGKILVGKTGTTSIPITTTNPVLNPNTNAQDYSDDVLTTYTLNANQVAPSFVFNDPFTNAPAATMNATSGSSPQAFTNTEVGTVTGAITPIISGTFGNDIDEKEGNFTAFNSPNYEQFGQSSITGDGLTGENDSIRAYMQWQAYQTASITSNNTSPLGAGGVATLSNKVSDDNINTPVGFSAYNNGLRAAAWVTGVTFNQGGWSQTGLTASANGSGTVLNGDGSNKSSTLTFNPTNKINGTYGATMVVALENEQDIQGAAVNDVTAVSFPLQTTVTANPSIQAGAYTLDGGTLTAPATNLTGSFTQTGGTSSFAGITGTGTVAISGGTASLTTGSGLSTVSSLAITANGALDIGNNHLIINYGAGTDPIASIAALIKSGFNGGAWTGLGITSAAAAANSGSYGIGYADSADPGNPAGLSSGQIEIKYTLLGDANLDGSVNGSDFAILATNFNKAVGGWDQGDFNYDGAANGADFAALAGNFNKGASQSAVDPSLLNFAAANGLLADVPEPASMGLLAVSGLSLLARRKRRVNG